MDLYPLHTTGCLITLLKFNKTSQTSLVYNLICFDNVVETLRTNLGTGNDPVFNFGLASTYTQRIAKREKCNLLKHFIENINLAFMLSD